MAASPEQAMMGCVMAAVCFWGLVKSRWFLAETPKGKRLQRWLGESYGLLLLRLLFALGTTAGAARAADWIRPISWG